MSMQHNLFYPIKIGHINLKNRVIRSATFEGMCDLNGFPTEEYSNLYERLARNDVGAIITGFAYVSRCGRAMHPGQAGIDDDAKISAYKRITEAVHQYECKIIMQIAHSGRQTTSEAVKGDVRGVSNKKSIYFDSTPKTLNTQETTTIARHFVDAASRAKEAGFDGVQLHAAHGYLIHQFILPSINNRNDSFGIDKKFGIGIHFLKMIIEGIREQCGEDFSLWVKVSAGHDYPDKFQEKNFTALIDFLDSMKVDAIEVSYGTMDYALNIFRGDDVPFDVILKHNPRFKTKNKLKGLLMKKLLYPFVVKPHLKIFTPNYNLPSAKLAKQHTQIPIICVGGFRSKRDMVQAVGGSQTDLVAMCRPFICEPDLVSKLTSQDSYTAKCRNCNRCAVMCDSGYSTRCYTEKN